MRSQRATNPFGVAVTLGATVAALVAVLLLSDPALFLCLLGVDAMCVMALVALWTVSTRAENRRLRDQLAALAPVRPSLRVVREPSDYDWPHWSTSPTTNGADQ